MWSAPRHESEQNVGVSREVFGAGVDNHVDAMIDGFLRDVYFPKSRSATVQEELEAFRRRGLVGVAHIGRDFSEWWDRREELLVPRVMGGMVEFSNIMNVLLGGRSFQDDVLPALEPGFTLVARRLSFDSLPSSPTPQLPGFAGIFRLQSENDIRAVVPSAFQSLVTIANMERGKEGKGSPLLLEFDELHGVKIYSASFEPPASKQAAPLGIEFNFSPSLAMVGSRVVLASNRELARVLVEKLTELDKALKARDSTPVSESFGDFVMLKSVEISKLLESNLEMMIAHIMVEESKSPEEARFQMGAIQDALGFVGRLELRSSRRDHGLELNLTLRARDRHVDASPEKKRKF